MSVSACLCVGLHVCPQTYLRNYMSIFKFSMHVISGGVAIRYVFPVIWTTSYIFIVHCLSENEVELSWFINGLDYTKAELRLQLQCGPELSMGPCCVTRSNPTQQVEKFGPNPT